MSDPSKDSTDKIAVPATKAGDRAVELIIVRGPGRGVVYRSRRRETVIGRAIDTDICLMHPSVSRYHARLEVEEEQAFIADLGSTNGTVVGVEHVLGRRRHVRDGETITIGRITFIKVTSTLSTQEGFKEAAFVSTTSEGIHVGHYEYLVDRVRAEYAHAVRRRTPLALLFVRADRAANHAAGALETEAVMNVVGAVVREATRLEDAVGRWSRSELIVLVRLDPVRARLMAERIRSAVRGRVAASSGLSLPQTVTVAIAPVNVGSVASAGTPGAGRPADAVDAVADSIVAVAGALARGAMNNVEDRVLELPALDAGKRARL